MSKTLKKVEKLFPKAKTVTVVEAFCVDDRLLVDAAFLMTFFDVGRRTLVGWQAKGMPSVKTMSGIGKAYDLIDAIQWYKENMTYNKSRKGSLGKLFAESVSPIEVSEKDLGKLKNEELVRLSSIEDLKKKRMLNDELEGRLIPAEDTDRAMAEQAVIHRSHYADDLELLPAALEGKTKTEIADFLETHYERRMKNTQTFITRVFEIPNYLYTKILELIDGEN